jgi:hypothetical protein
MIFPCEVVTKPELQLGINKGCWLRTIVKNDKTEINNARQKEIDNQTKINPINVFYTIHLLKTTMKYKEMQKIRIPAFFKAYSLKHVAIEKLVCLKMELPKINRSARLAMNSTVALTHYSPFAASNNSVCALITKDEINQKEEVNKLLILEKEKFEKNTLLSEEEKENQDKYNKLFYI